MIFEMGEKKKREKAGSNPVDQQGEIFVLSVNRCSVVVVVVIVYNSCCILFDCLFIKLLNSVTFAMTKQSLKTALLIFSCNITFL